MGDRAHCVVKNGDEEVYLYTHWNGSELPQLVRAAMRRVPGRWDDPAYLARAIFSQMIVVDVLGEHGFGIWSRAVEDDSRDVIVDVGSRTVRVRRTKTTTVTFEEFVAGKGGR